MDLFRFRESDLGSFVGKVEYIHDEKQNTSCAFLKSERSALRIVVPRAMGITSLSVTILDESQTQRLISVNAKWRGISESSDIYALTLPNLDIGLYFYVVEADTIFGRLYGLRDRQTLVFSKEPTPEKLFQLSFSDFIHDIDESLYGGVIYQIFVDRFAKGGRIARKDGSVYVDDWSSGIPEYPAYPGAPLKNNTFYGGTLYGIIDKLPYIASLGANIIYLSPIFASPSNHKYDTADYMKVDPMFGGDEALKQLIESAREFGIGIILDGVFNHTGADSIYFNKYGTYESIGAYQSTASPYYSWYDFKEYPDDYTSWWGIEILPRINPDIPKCREYFVGAGGVVDKYARMGILGMRLDVVDELSDDFIAAIKARLAERIKMPLLYGEVWEDGSNKIAYDKRKRYFLGEELDGVMNYPIRTGIIDYLRFGKTDRIFYALTDIMDNAPRRIRDMQMNLLGTHDTPRILTALAGELPTCHDNAYLRTKRMSDEEMQTAISRLKMAYTILATLPGIPTVFYGDEAGLEGYSDPFNRMPYPWGREVDALMEHYKAVGSLRRSNITYAKGDFKLLHIDSERLIYARTLGATAYLTVVNNSSNTLEVSFDASHKALLGKSEVLKPFTAEVFKLPITACVYI